MTTTEQTQSLKRTTPGNVSIILNTSAGSISRTLVNTSYRPPVISVDAKPTYLQIGSSVRIEAIVTYSNLPADKDIVWASSNPNVVTVDQNGNLLALKKGEAILTLKSKKDLSVNTKIDIIAYSDEDAS